MGRGKTARVCITETHIGILCWSSVQQYLSKCLFNSVIWQKQKHHLPSSSSHLSFYYAFFFRRSLLQGTKEGNKNIFFFCFHPESGYDEQIVQQKLFTGGAKTRNSTDKWAPQLAFVKQLMLLVVGKSARGHLPVLLSVVYVVVVVGFSLCQE